MENQAACGLAVFFYVQGIAPHKMMFAAWKYTSTKKRHHTMCDAKLE